MIEEEGLAATIKTISKLDGALLEEVIAAYETATLV